MSRMPRLPLMILLVVAPPRRTSMDGPIPLKVARRAIDVGGDAGGYAAFRNPSLGQPVDMVARHTKSIAADAANPTNNLAAPTPMSSMTTSNAPNHAPRPIFVPKVDMIYGDDLARARRNLQLEKNFQSSAGRTRPKLRVPDAMFRQGPSTKPQRPADEPAAQSEGQIVDMGWKEMLGMLEQKVGALEAENRKLQHENDQFRAWLNQAPK
ncbi:uncharacterized protein NECHADRAFT_106292 [Fusarium vanettenii 77-13-4]|uniref:BZIP domain-containing protein n=1 Tax=Fusarium vanettenii (strain ATCC MYA-4622 / CBS 123669 / FGSC 9596 / NRRL 45880 / 77-13-4) TaxID=660122 RepID=C7Z3N9_FUSV7|nr:uncharacterized protein NECHADRAFT_106292 [Fusarium vanettenii 77-13-4]EEU41341.1 predicted protein [Fusarium vanettenii 77-13-4]